MTTEELIDKLKGFEDSEVRLPADLDEMEVKSVQYDEEKDVIYIIGNCE